jgi:hypothetical protein
MIEIKNNQTGEYIILDWGDPIDFIPNLLTDSKLKNLYTCQYHIYKNFNDDRIRKFTYMEKHWEGTFNFTPHDIEKTNPKMIFIGTILPQRSIIHHLGDYLDASLNRFNFLVYLKIMKTYRISFSPPGGSDISLRDCESFGLGIPVLRQKFKADLEDPLIDGVHYISCEEDSKESVIEKFNLVVNDYELLNTIAINARAWYDRNISNGNIIKTTFLKIYESNL